MFVIKYKITKLNFCECKKITSFKNLELLYIYIFEDDPIQSTFLSNVASKFFPKSRVKVAGKLSDIIELLKKASFPAIFLIDVVLEDANGLNVLKKINQIFADKLKFTIVMTAGNDNSVSIEALKLGADDFFQKPILAETLISRLINAKRYINQQVVYAKQQEQIQFLEEEQSKNRERMLKLIYEFQVSKIPVARKHTENIQKAANWIVQKLLEDESQIERISLASKYVYIGKLFLPDNMINLPVLTNGFVTNENMNKVPGYTRELLSQIPDIDDIINVLTHIWENFDGTGIPDKQKAWEIPLESRILRVAIDYEYFLDKNQGKQNKTIDTLFNEANRLYDFRIIAFYDQYLASLNLRGKSGSTREVPMLVSELQPGYMLSRSIITKNGLKLVSGGTKLNEDNIHKILTINKEEGIIGSIYVYDPPKI